MGSSVLPHEQLAVPLCVVRSREPHRVRVVFQFNFDRGVVPFQPSSWPFKRSELKCRLYRVVIQTPMKLCDPRL
ncbi:hypothetical protein J4Q44_G00356730 [Coregonus suidteri]|uniref:Uncharacterized protein n=1 Tax=Coregonus suidteri TaxID=861788 RepID=A0AAN8QKX5_9TELE